MYSIRICSLVFVSLALWLTTHARAETKTPETVLVDVAKVFKDHKRFSDAMARIKKEVDEYQLEVKAAKRRFKNRLKK